MRIRVRTVLLGLSGLLVILVVGGLTAVGWQVVLGPRMRPVTARKFDVTNDRLKRGQYLVEGVAACFHCHSDHDLTDPEYPVIQAKKGAGWQLPIPELGQVYPPNITPDPETGIGKWTDDEIARAIQEGVANDGRPLFPIMPYMNFRHLDDEDLASIVVYLRSIPPVHNVVPLSTYVFPLNILIKTMPQPLTSHEPAPARTTAEARGEYLVRSIAGCQDCHTPTNEKGVPLPGMEFGGGGLFHDPGHDLKTLVSLNITPDPSGIMHYDEAMFVQTLHSGQIPGRMLNHIMPLENYRNMTDDDLKDIFAYLKTRPAVKHRVSNTDPPAFCPVCMQTHGLGELNKK